MEFFDLIRDRYSVRKYADKPVEQEKKPEAPVEVTPAAAKTEDKPKRQRRIKVD